ASALLGACTTDTNSRERDQRLTPAVVDRNSASNAAVTEDLQLLQRLVQGAPAEQAEISAGAQRDYDTAPTPSRPRTRRAPRSCCASSWPTPKCFFLGSVPLLFWNCSKLTTI